MKATNFAALLFGLFLAACVTINVYFPAAAAEQAADKIINDVLGTEDSDNKTKNNDSAAISAPGETCSHVHRRGCWNF